MRVAFEQQLTLGCTPGPAHVNKRDIVFFALLPNNLID